MTTRSRQIVGVDLASSTENTAACLFRVTDSDVVVETFETVDNDRIHGWLRDENTVTGIDAPFGWPAPFAGAVGSWMLLAEDANARAWPEWAQRVTEDEAWWDDLKELLQYRVTDRFVRLYGKHLHNCGSEDTRCPAALRSTRARCPVPVVGWSLGVSRSHRRDDVQGICASPRGERNRSTGTRRRVRGVSRCGARAMAPLQGRRQTVGGPRGREGVRITADDRARVAQRQSRPWRPRE